MGEGKVTDLNLSAGMENAMAYHHHAGRGPQLKPFGVFGCLLTQGG